jgi:hypothetical protein
MGEREGRREVLGFSTKKGERGSIQEGIKRKALLL